MQKMTITMFSALGSYTAAAGKKGICFAYRLSNRIEDTLQLRSVTPSPRRRRKIFTKAGDTS